MQVRKRNGDLVEFQKEKIVNAIQKANNEVSNIDKLSSDKILDIVNNIEEKLLVDKIIDVEQIQDLVEEQLFKIASFKLSQAYSNYRFLRKQIRTPDNLEMSIMNLIDGKNEELATENSNKDAKIISTQRDYMAGELSKKLARKYLYSDDVIKAHDDGVIHIHDLDYGINPMTNCCLVNLENCLQNGTVMSGTKIYKPKSFAVACTIASQIIMSVASSQYGGQTITLSHLAPFINVSREKIRHQVIDECSNNNIPMTVEQINSVVHSRLLQEIKAGVQTLQHQIVTLQSTNGQAPFLTVFMYLNEVKDEQTKADLAILIEEVLNQRIEGLPNEQGINISPTFPKLIYVLEEDNIVPNSKYFYLTELAAKCTSKRMVPDYISEKKMKEIKVDENGEGHCFPSMGCLDYNETLNIICDNTPNYKNGPQKIKIGDLFEYISSNKNNLSHYENPELLNRAKDINNAEDREKFLKNGYLIYSGAHFNQWAINFKNTYGRKPTKLDFKELTGVIWDKRSIMVQRGADLSLVSQWDSYWELKICDLLNYNGFRQIYLQEECVSKKDYIRNKVFNSKGVKKQLDIYFPELNLGIEVNDFASHDRESDTSAYTTPYGIVEHRNNLKGYKKGPKHSIAKKQFFNDLGIYVIEIWEDEIKNKEFVSILSNILNENLRTNDWGNIKVSELHTPAVDCIDLVEKGYFKYVEDIDGSYTRILKIMRNFNISDWLRIKTDALEILVTSDHPLINYEGQVIAGELSVGDYILNNNNEAEFIKVIEKVERITCSYDIETETHTFVFSGVQSHNCRSFLSPYIDGNNQPQYYGRFNLGVVTLNLPYIALQANKDLDKFWELLEHYSNLAYKAHIQKTNRLEQFSSDVAPILWQHGVLARLRKGEKISKLFKGGYSTISLGYGGIYECVMALIGKSHTSEEGKELAIVILKRLNKYCDKWKEQTGLGFSIYGTPLESTTWKFSKANQKEFGIIPEITEYSYITNSYHVNVREEIDAFSKLKLESEFQELSSGGSISYIECPDMSNNIPAILDVLKYIYHNIVYAELNLRSDYCFNCGYDGEIYQSLLENGDYEWTCPNCGNHNLDKMNITRRVCGYLGQVQKGVNNGRLGDYYGRVLHL